MCATSGIRIHQILSTNYSKTDLTWDGFGINVWSTVESCCSIIGACLPTMRPLVTRARALATHSGTKTSRESGKVMPRSSGITNFIHKSKVSSWVFPPFILQSQRTPYESIEGRDQPVEDRELPYQLQEIPKDIRRDAYRTASAPRGGLSPHVEVRSQRSPQDRPDAPPPSPSYTDPSTV